MPDEADRRVAGICEKVDRASGCRLEVEVDDESDTAKMVNKAESKPEPIEESVETDRVKKARKTAQQKRDLAMLGTKIAVLPTGDKK